MLSDEERAKRIAELTKSIEETDLNAIDDNEEDEEDDDLEALLDRSEDEENLIGDGLGGFHSEIQSALKGGHTFKVTDGDGTPINLTSASGVTIVDASLGQLRINYEDELTDEQKINRISDNDTLYASILAGQILNGILTIGGSAIQACQVKYQIDDIKEELERETTDDKIASMAVALLKEIKAKLK